MGPLVIICGCWFGNRATSQLSRKENHTRDAGGPHLSGSDTVEKSLLECGIVMTIRADLMTIDVTRDGCKPMQTWFITTTNLALC